MDPPNPTRGRQLSGAVIALSPSVDLAITKDHAVAVLYGDATPLTSGNAVHHLSGHNLVVNGPDAGHVWLDDRACDGPISPQVDDTDRITFDRWYLTWLEQAEATCAGHATT
jgi:hypothetical protein